MRMVHCTALQHCPRAVQPTLAAIRALPQPAVLPRSPANMDSAKADELALLVVRNLPQALLVVLVVLVVFLIAKDLLNGVLRRPFLNPDQWQPLTLVDVKKLSHNTKRFRFALPHQEQALGLPLGQHISIRGTAADGSAVFRCAGLGGPACLLGAAAGLRLVSMLPTDEGAVVWRALMCSRQRGLPRTAGLRRHTAPTACCTSAGSGGGPLKQQQQQQ